ncbi:hypothetical protein [Bythopirellula polymerisocia]|uniref:Uncharacterized protein n=1 Tax=Bythopirellula polymerisocia TaxID=2528003 RepID=A0A5C6CQA4_9BACT|nr:hypothetical protein [Bythopirellula polymerisocia]TWU25684.1 hypothetical protein Pla144_28930 [Bythopirellula polymerisocia]
MAKNQNTFEKMRREVEKKRKNDEKRERRRKKKEGILEVKPHDLDSTAEEPDADE